MFRSARVKLTLFYLAILLGFCLVLTFAFRVLASDEYGASNSDQSAAVRHYYIQPFYNDGLQAPPVSRFSNVQADASSVWHDHLDRDLAIVDVVALSLGGLLSYWYAGRTLKPIEEAHNAQKRFAADASHELRTPLTNLRLENEVFLRQKQFTDAEARAQITSNLEEVQRLQQLSSDLLDLTQYGQTALQQGAVGIVHVVEAAVHQTHQAAKAKKVKVTTDMTDGTVLGHHDSLVQLVGILLDNAIKYGPESGTVTIRGGRHGGQYIVQVVDEGAGIDPKDLPHIFDRLYRGDKARSSKTGGYGLGLSLAQEIAHANHAHITAANVKAPKTGASFEFRLEVA